MNTFPLCQNLLESWQIPRIIALRKKFLFLLRKMSISSFIQRMKLMMTTNLLMRIMRKKRYVRSFSKHLVLLKNSIEHNKYTRLQRRMVYLQEVFNKKVFTIKRPLVLQLIDLLQGHKAVGVHILHLCDVFISITGTCIFTSHNSISNISCLS